MKRDKRSSSPMRKSASSSDGKLNQKRESKRVLKASILLREAGSSFDGMRKSKQSTEKAAGLSGKRGSINPPQQRGSKRSSSSGDRAWGKKEPVKGAAKVAPEVLIQAPMKG
jgi:hypothetical protein